MNRSIGALVLAASWALLQPAESAIVGVSVPTNSQGSLSRPFVDGVYSATAVAGQLDVDTGIGIILKPTWLSVGWVQPGDPIDYALHQNGLFQSPPYAAPNVPNAAASTVTYFFDQPTVVRGVEIVQHINGVTSITGRLGNSFGSMASIGSASGPTAPDGTSVFFNFGNTSVSGLIFEFTVTGTSNVSAFALHRAFPLDGSGIRVSPVPEPSTALLLAAGVLAVVSRRIVRRAR